MALLPEIRQQYQLEGRAQGTTYTIKYIGVDSIIKQKSVDSIFKVIDQSLSLYHPNSLINQFNANGKVQMDFHMHQVIEKALEVNKISGGAFDITVKPLVDLWGFGVKKNFSSIPVATEIQKVLQVIGSKNLVIKKDSLFALKKGVQIDCNGIAQGYTVDVIAGFLEQNGLKDFMVEVGGEIKVLGKNGMGENWKVGVEAAEIIAGEWHPINSIIELNDEAITTSGVYRNFFNFKGERYSHIINPKTGFPVKNKIVAVTVIAENAITADAWDNALMVMGIDAINKNKWLVRHCTILTTQNNVKDISLKAKINIH
jgi:FAD:protein FMN transferase